MTVSHITGITPRNEKSVTMFKSESLIGYKICKTGQIAANTIEFVEGDGDGESEESVESVKGGADEG